LWLCGGEGVGGRGGGGGVGGGGGGFVGGGGGGGVHMHFCVCWECFGLFNPVHLGL